MDISKKELTLPEIGLLATTRVALGVGIGLLLAQRLSAERRTAAGWSLLLVGLVTTVPLAAQIFGEHDHRSADCRGREAE